jgi:cellulase/cellobiase CelA1
VKLISSMALKLVVPSSSAFVNTFPNNQSIDHFSPLFLNNGENPTLNLVGNPLSKDNYNTWSRSMLVLLSVENKLCFVDASSSSSFFSHLLFLSPNLFNLLKTTSFFFSALFFILYFTTSSTQ